MPIKKTLLYTLVIFFKTYTIHAFELKHYSAPQSSPINHILELFNRSLIKNHSDAREIIQQLLITHDYDKVHIILEQSLKNFCVNKKQIQAKNAFELLQYLIMLNDEIKPNDILTLFYLRNSFAKTIFCQQRKFSYNKKNL